MTKILLVDDFGIVREGLRALLEDESDMEVVGEARNGREAVSLTKNLHPDVVIMDVTMPGMNGIEATRLIREQVPSARVIALSVHAVRHYVIEILRAGAMAYVLKLYLFEELMRAIHTVMKGDHYLSPQITDVVVDDIVSKPSSSGGGGLSILTERQLEILRLIAEGRSTKGIAFELSVSPKTIDGARRDIMKRLGIDSVAGLTKYAVRQGLVKL